MLKSKKLSLAAVLALLGATLVAPPAWAQVLCATTEGMKITDNVVTGNTNCTEAVIPNTVTSIGTSAFEGATALNTVTFAAGSALTSIANNAFAGATSLSSITIPNGVTSIGSSAFKGATSLTSFTFEGNAPETVGADAFSSVGTDPVVNVNFAATGFGTATTWNGLTIVRASGIPEVTPVISDELKAWTKLLRDGIATGTAMGTAKIYAKNIVGAGKIQFMLNGEEIAWVRAVSAADPKLRTANGAHYLVRTVDLVEGQKNVLEVYLDGVRIMRTAYSY